MDTTQISEREHFVASTPYPSPAYTWQHPCSFWAGFFQDVLYDVLGYPTRTDAERHLITVHSRRLSAS